MKKNYSIIIIGVSAGGMNVLPVLLKRIPADFPIPIVVVQHQTADSDDFLANFLDNNCLIKVKELEEKERISSETVYIAPANYHVLFERDHTFSLDVSAPVNYSRPSIDVVLESAAAIYKDKTIAVILTGANDDGAYGAKLVSELGGLVIAQDPDEAEVPVMPLSAINLTKTKYILSINNIAKKLIELIVN